MSWLPDPFQLAEAPSIAEPEIDVEEPPSNEEIFYGSIRHYPDTAGSELGIHVDACRFDEDGNHVQMAKRCPHYDAEDEQGRRIAPGWTVQSRNR